MPLPLDELTLVLAAKAGDRTAMQRLIERNAGAINLAVRCMHPADQATEDDLRQDGVLGVLEAIRRFDSEIASEHGNGFFTFALYRIKYQVQRGAARLYGRRGEETSKDLDKLPKREPDQDSPDPLAHLPEAERRVLWLLYGLDGHEPRRRAKVARILNTTVKQVSDLHRSGIAFLRCCLL